jgi:2-methylcitrate dehydratase
MIIEENKRYSKEYLEADKRSIANSIQIFFNDGSTTEKIEVEYPIGHRRRREEGIPILLSKFENNLKSHFDENKVNDILQVCSDPEKLSNTDVNDFMSLFSKKFK